MTTPGNKIRFAIAGYGHIGRRHAAEIIAHPQAELCAIADIDETARQLAATQNVPVFSSLADLLRQISDLDVVNICTPNGLHITQAEEALKSGKNVIVEKPMGLRRQACDDLISLAKEKDKKIFCVLQNRYSPPSRLMKKLIEEKSLGRIFWVEVNCYWNRDERYYTRDSWRGTQDMDGGPLYTQFSHFVDLLYWTFGPVKNLKGSFYNFNHPQLKGLEDSGFFSFDFEKGGAGIFSYSTALWDRNMESSITVIGEKGAVKVGGQYMDRLDYFHVENIERPQLDSANPPNDYGTYQGSAANHAFVIDNVIKALKGQPYDIAGPEEAAASVDIIEQVYRLRNC